jgi:hypothetical protein
MKNPGQALHHIPAAGADDGTRLHFPDQPGLFFLGSFDLSVRHIINLDPEARWP